MESALRSEPAHGDEEEEAGRRARPEERGVSLGAERIVSASHDVPAAPRRGEQHHREGTPEPGPERETEHQAGADGTTAGAPHGPERRPQ